MSQDGASQFQEVIRQELELSVKKELEKILTTASSHEFEVRRSPQCFFFSPRFICLHAELLPVMIIIIQPQISTRCMITSKTTTKKIELLDS